MLINIINIPFCNTSFNKEESFHQKFGVFSKSQSGTTWSKDVDDDRRNLSAILQQRADE